MKHQLQLLATLLLTLMAGNAFSQSKGTQLDHYFADVDRQAQFNGIMLVAPAGQPVYQHCAGYADIANKKANRPGNRFNLASISKIFTSTAILQLRDKNKLKLDYKVNAYLSDFPYANVTIRHLLTHTSGLPDLELYEDLIHQYPDTVITNKNVLPELKRWNKGLYFNPGDEFRYCNTEYSLLALLIEKITHTAFQAYMSQHIFKPAGMKSTYISEYSANTHSPDPLLVQMQEHARRFTDSTYINVDSITRYRYTNYNCSGTVGESGVITTTNDLLRFDRAFFSGKLLKSSSVEEALTPLKLNSGRIYEGPMDTMQGDGKGYYGLGWEIFDQPGSGRSVGHGGFKFGLATFYIHHLTSRQAMIAFDNAPGPAFGQVVTGTFQILNGKTPSPFAIKRSLAMLYGNTIVHEGADMAITRLNSLKADTIHYYLNEWEMDKVGGELFFGSTFPGHQELGLEAFKLNTILFPGGFNTYDSYGEALRIVGKKQAAILEYRKSVALNPKNEGGIRALAEMAK